MTTTGSAEKESEPSETQITAKSSFFSFVDLITGKRT